MNAPRAFAPPLPLAGEGRGEGGGLHRAPQLNAPPHPHPLSQGGEGARQKQPAALIQQASTAIKNTVLLAAGLLPGLCAAQTAPGPQDVALLAGNCVTCHGPDGRAPPGSSIPTLRGRSSAELLERMQAFQAGRVAGATVMPLLMQGYDKAQMQALARWFAESPAHKP